MAAVLRSSILAVVLIACVNICSAFRPGNSVAFTASVGNKISQQTSCCRVGVSVMQMNGDGSDTQYKKIFVAGGSRGVGRHIIDNIIGSGSSVVALVRSDDAAKSLNEVEGVTAIVGDAFDYKAVEGAMDGCDAAITTLGQGNVGEGEKRVDYEGSANVIEAAGILGVTRLVLVTSVGCGSSKEAAPPSVFEVLKDVLKAKERAENILIKYYTNMNWTIIRPGGLKSEPATGKAILTEDPMAIGTIHREDVANLVVKALGSAKTERKILSAVDPTIIAAHADGREVEQFALA